ncbi:hypothetical protein [Limosilactobacillus reuteri]|uniref:hypothetical protein n=1 Tax=Limosilactobacillus reuteri TaxID=1598 RepID=UPI001E41E9D3|nr:hypothetical protein [Limosilactobacillus reuteri]UFK69129.1 hypothetical protein IVR12_02240 [Limosilactobacillus reuteri]
MKLDKAKISVDLDSNKILYKKREIKEINSRLKNKLKVIKNLGSGKNGVTFLVTRNVNLS